MISAKMSLNSTNLSIVKRLLPGGNRRPIQSLLAKLQPADIAPMFGQLNNREQKRLLGHLIDLNLAHQTLNLFPEDRLGSFLEKLDNETIIKIIEQASDDVSAYFLGLLAAEPRSEILSALSRWRAERLQNILEYEEESSGRIMRTGVFTIPDSLTCGQALETLRQRTDEDSLFYIYCVQEDSRLSGVASLRQIAIASPETSVSDIMDTRLVTIHPETSEKQAAELISHYDFIALPVVDQDRHLLGIVTVDDILDVVEDQATAEIYASAGLQEDDRVYSPISFSFKNRLPWMILNLALACSASFVVSLFEATMSQLIVLASLNNIVAGIGGNTAIQTLTVVTRGLATGDFDFIKVSKAIMKESAVGISLGFCLGLLAGMLVYFWKDSTVVAVIIFLSMLFNSIVASSFGAIIPIVLRKLGRDPAIGSGVLVTTLTDIFGFFSFLGMATLALTYL
jgi:magnesium transporter